MAHVYFPSRERTHGSIIVAAQDNKKPVDIVINSDRVEGLLAMAENSEFTEVTMFSGERYVLPNYTLEEVADKLGYSEKG